MNFAIRAFRDRQNVRSIGFVVDIQPPDRSRLADLDEFLGQVDRLQRPAVRKVIQNRFLAAGQNRLLDGWSLHGGHHPFEQCPPGSFMEGLSVHLSVRPPVDRGCAVLTFRLRNQRGALPGFRIKRHDLSARRADARVDPSRAVHRDCSGILGPVFMVERSIVCQFSRIRLEAQQFAVGIRGRPDHAAIVFRKRHGEIRRRVGPEREAT